MHLPSLLLVSSALSILWSTTTNANETDRLALLAIKSQLHDPLGVTRSWNTSVNLCQWTGVTCSHRHQRVTMLELPNQRIGGSLSPHVGNLSFLRFIDIGDNAFHGEIPNEVGRLFRLETLIVANNSFSGNIPNNLSRCSNLILFYAHKNNLVGEIPAGFGYLLKLEKLSIGFNNLTGQIPAFIGNLSALQVFYIRDTGLHGRIPHSLGQLRNLVYLHVGQNQLSGMVPPSIYNISSLENIYLSLNRFIGTLPLDIGLNLPNLREFGIAANNFFGALPDSLTNASNLEIIDLSHNQFKGKVSINFGSFKNLSLLSLGANNLGTGGAENDLDFVTLLTNCSKFETLGLFENQFGGVLPHSIANLSTTIETFEMRRNQISGTIPRRLGNLVNLYVFALESNQLTGTIPDVIGELKNLQSLYLDGNFLQGTIPSSLGNLTGLVELDLSFNNLTGSLPSSFGNFRGLLKLFISENKLIGTLPHKIFSSTTFMVDLSGNLFSGSFPPEVGNLKNVLYLDISRNRFSGEIPVTLSACTSLEYLNMRDNSFSGSIPLSLRFLKSIRKLDVSRNNLSGQIPKYFENLFFLEYLNLSFNHFEGEVPIQGVFKNKTRFSLLGNEKLCGGINELHLQSCRSKGSRKLRVRLLKVVVPVIVSCLILSACFVIVYARRRKSANKSSTMQHMEEQFPMLSYGELSKATNEFSSSNIIGQGSYGIVYKGILSETGMIVAVKVLNLVRKGALKSFIAECEALRNIRHRNLVKIITICSSIDFKRDNFKALVYEYMENGSLDEWLHKSNNDQDVSRDLSLIERLNIAIDVASAIEYLHFHSQPPVVHGDLKPSNVLLDHDMVAHVGDFGLAKFLFARPPDTDLEIPSNSTGIKGTIGYVAPEYGMGGETSKAGDVYSFGILLLAMFTGRRPTDTIFTEGLSLHEFVKMALPQKMVEIVDPSLLLEVIKNNSKECLIVVFRTGVLCSMESPKERMEMRDVVAKLCIAKETFLGEEL